MERNEQIQESIRTSKVAMKRIVGKYNIEENKAAF